MKIRNVLLNFMMLSGISLVITGATYFVNMWLFSSNLYLREQTRLSPTDAFFLEGIVFLIVGFLLLLGKGGINLWSLKASLSSALAEFLYGGDTVGPDEIFRKDRWKPRGFVRIALILVLTGMFMILTARAD